MSSPATSGATNAAQPNAVARDDRAGSPAGVGRGSVASDGAGRGGRLKAIRPEAVRPKMTASRWGRSSGERDTWISARPNRSGVDVATDPGSPSPTCNQTPPSRRSTRAC